MTRTTTVQWEDDFNVRKGMLTSKSTILNKTPIPLRPGLKKAAEPIRKSC